MHQTAIWEKNPPVYGDFYEIIWDGVTKENRAIIEVKAEIKINNYIFKVLY